MAANPQARRNIAAVVVLIVVVLAGEAAATALFLHGHVLAAFFLAVAAPFLAKIAVGCGWLGVRS